MELPKETLLGLKKCYTVLFWTCIAMAGVDVVALQYVKVTTGIVFSVGLLVFDIGLLNWLIGWCERKLKEID